MQVIVLGIPELKRKLLALEAATSQAVLSSAVCSGAKLVEKDAKRIVRKRTRKLEGAIRSSPSEEKPTRVVYDVGFEQKSFYGRFLELGTKKMAAYPFLRPAFDENKEQVVKVISETLRAAILAVR